MKTKCSVAERPGGGNDEIRIVGYPKFSSRENFYHQYHEQKVTKPWHYFREDLSVNPDEPDEFLAYAISDDEENSFYNFT